MADTPNVLDITDPTEFRNHIDGLIIEQRNRGDHPEYLELLESAQNIRADQYPVFLQLMTRIGNLLDTVETISQASKPKPPIWLTEEQFNALGSMGGPGETESCTICLENFKSCTMLKILPCKHPFHIECAKEWLCKQGSSVTCPTCREDYALDSDE